MKVTYDFDDPIKLFIVWWFFIILLSMKKSDEFLSPASPASFLKKQSHIITKNGISQ